MAHTVYHCILRVSALTVALVLLFDSGVVSPITKQLSHNTWVYLANSTGVFAQVEPNELNVLTAELTLREKELEEREAALRLIEARNFQTDGLSNYSTYILSFILFILTSLIVLNYVLDWRRARLVVSV
jgi:hypothetical protein